MNKYLTRLNNLIREYRDADLVQFVGPNNQKAGWDDLVWYFICPNTGRQVRFLACRPAPTRLKDCELSRELSFFAHYAHLVKVWIIEVCNRPISAMHKNRLVGSCRHFLSAMDGDLYVQTAKSIRRSYSNRSAELNSFLDFCSERGLMPKVRLPSDDTRDRTGHARLDAQVEKLPDIQTIVAIGAIFNEVFKPVNEDGSVRPGETVVTEYALAALCGALCLASPNRAAAEIPVIPKQQLQVYREGAGEPVYYLDWKGSKGHKDYKNHILAVLSSQIAKGVNFFYKKCEPARILCRFYEDRTQTLKALLGDYDVSPERAKHLRLTKPPTLFQLGYALGFYGVEERVPVLKKGAVLPAGVASHHKYAYFEQKLVYAIQLSDQVSTAYVKKVRIASLPRLLLTDFQSRPFRGRALVTVAEVQEWWIDRVRTTFVPTFPFSFSSGESSIRLSDALFCIQGCVFRERRSEGKSGHQCFQSSPFSVVSAKTIGTSMTHFFGGTSKKASIFERFGYSSELATGTHKLRHFANTLAHMSDIPVEVISAWSGRVDREQTHTYIHTSHEARADKVRAIINPSKKDRQDIRVVLANDVTQATNLPATITSTGICTQELNVTPCDYLNDFVSHCFMCSEACHIAGDDKAIEFLQKDCAYQQARLRSVERDPRRTSSNAMQQWYVIHSRNVVIMSTLIELMKHQPKGSVIRYEKRCSEFHLTDLTTKAITRVACALPRPEEQMKRLLDGESKDAAPSSFNPQLVSLLSQFGLDGREA